MNKDFIHLYNLYTRDKKFISYDTLMM